jgi:hypothetical protein
MSERLRRIIEENKRFERESPYNFCDRWCERCTHEKQLHCRLYLDEFEQKTTCIAHGRDEDDPEITAYVLEKQFEGVEEAMEKINEENEIDFEDLPQDIQKHIRFVENNPLEGTAKQYRKKAHAFLEATFYKDWAANPELKYDFETVSWYHALLEVKLHRALCGFHEPASEGDISLCDAVAQFEICKKAAGESIKALRKIKGHFPGHRIQIASLIALLHNIDGCIGALLERV